MIIKHDWLKTRMMHRLLEKVDMIRGGSRTATTSKMEHFVIIVNGWKPLTIITKSSILDVAAVLGPPLVMSTSENGLRYRFNMVLKAYKRFCACLYLLPHFIFRSNHEEEIYLKNSYR